MKLAGQLSNQQWNSLAASALGTMNSVENDYLAKVTIEEGAKDSDEMMGDI